MSTLRVEALEQPDGTAFVFNNKNLLINGGHNIWQRSTSASVSSDTFSTVDRWRTGVNGMGVFTVSRSTDVPSAQGFGYSCKYDCTTADTSPAANDYIAHYQTIEGQNLQHLLKGTSSAKAVTVSFWVKSNKTGTYILDLFDNDNTRQISKAYTIDSASTWEKKTITFPGDTSGTLDNDNAQSMRLLWWMGAGSTYSSGTLNTSWASTTEANRAVGVVNLADSTSNEFYITGCQLEVGSTASGFEFEPYETVLRKCLRYFERYDNNTVDDGGMPQGYCQVDVSNRPEIGLFYSRKRANPTISGSSAVQFFHAANSNVTTTGGPNTFVGTGLYGANLFYTCSSGVTPNTLSGIGYVQLGSGDYINIDSEL